MPEVSPALSAVTSLVEDQHFDPTLATLWEMGEDSEPGQTGYYVNGAGVLMHKYSPKNMSSTQTWKVRHRVVVPGKHCQSIMQLAHDNISSGHVGAAKTLAKVKDQFIWPAMSRDIKRYCASCLYWSWTHSPSTATTTRSVGSAKPKPPTSVFCAGRFSFQNTTSQSNT